MLGSAVEALSAVLRHEDLVLAAALPQRVVVTGHALLPGRGGRGRLGGRLGWILSRAGRILGRLRVLLASYVESSRAATVVLATVPAVVVQVDVDNLVRLLAPDVEVGVVTVAIPAAAEICRLDC